jgi:hypothetical protein
MDVLLLSQWLTTGFMTGLIWFVQVVHYPIYTRVGPEKLPEYQAFHVRRTTLVVFPAMVAELIGGCLLLIREWQGPSQQPALWGVGLLGVIWLSTLIFQIPMHGKIGQSISSTDKSRAEELNAINSLVKTNWIRTIAWSGRLILLVACFPPATNASQLQG